MRVCFNVPEAEYLAYKQSAAAANGTRVRLRMANGQPFEFPGEVTAIEADFNNETGNIAFRATFPNPKGLLRHGETGSMLLDTRLTNVLLIPQMATFEVLDHRYVFAIAADSTVHTTRVDVSGDLQNLFIVRDGSGRRLERKARQRTRFTWPTASWKRPLISVARTRHT
jgi:membrane fusion protein (multidrug efflux system)